jgi:hypothetical protein
MMNVKHVATAGALVLALAGACAGVGNSQEHLRSAVEAQRPTLDECYAEALARDASLSGQLALMLYVDKADGRVRDAQVTDAGVNDLALQECVRSSLVGVTLEERPKVELEVGYTFEFVPAS